MSVGGSILTTEGLNTFVETGASVVPKYFKFSADTVTLNTELTDIDFNSWIQKDISLYQTINDNTIEFVCDVLPGDATQFTNTCGLYLEDGTLFMVATPPNAFPSGLRQTFRIQLVYENAATMMDFQYIDMDNTNIKFQEVITSIEVLDTNTDARMTIIEDTHSQDSIASMSRLDALESVDTNVDNRIDTLENNYLANKSTMDSTIININDNRTQDLSDLAAAQLIQDNRITVNETDIDAVEAKSILDRTELEGMITDVASTSDTGNLATLIQDNTDLINANDVASTTLINTNASDISTTRSDLTTLINTNETTSNAADTALDTRITNLDNSTTLSVNTINSSISTIDALILSNKTELDSNIQANTDAIAALGSTDTSVLQDQIDALEGTISSNNTAITTALSNSDTASDTWNSTQDAAIALNTTFRTDTFVAAQAAQDTALANSISAQALINTSDGTRITSLETTLADLPDVTELGNLADAVADNDLAITEIIDGTIVTAHSTLANTADKWTTPRTVTLTGDVTGSFTIDGSGNVSFATTAVGGDYYDTVTSDARYVNIAGDTMTGNLGVGQAPGAQSTFQAGSLHAGKDHLDTPWIYSHCIEAPDERGGASTGIAIGMDGYFNAGHDALSLFTNGLARLVVNANGSVTTTGDLTVTTNLSAGSITETSALRYKENILTLDNALDKVQALNGVSYDWIETSEPDIGFIAEEVLDVLPELVQFNDDGEVQGMNYSKITALLVQGMKEQQLQILELQARL